LIPILTTTTSTKSSSTLTTTISASQIYGIDISTEMIKCGQELYPDCHFIAGDFLHYQPTTTTTTSLDTTDSDRFFDGIIFCSSLHDMPNIYLVLEKAISLLRNEHGSTIVIVHAQGAGHVQMQHVKNPILVPKLLPTATELKSFIDSYNHNNEREWNSNVDNNNDDDIATTRPLLLQLTVAPDDPNTPNDNANGYLAVIQKIKTQ
jgi:hypothetical protein